MKTLIYTVAIDSDTSKYKNSEYSEASILSWTAWCKKRGIDFYAINDPLPRYKHPIWNKDRVFEIFGDKYDKIGYVDSDTMPKWDCPNPFDQYNDEYTGIKEISSLRWIGSSINYFQQFFPNVYLPWDEYINSGVTFFTKEHKFIYDELIDLYVKNTDRLDAASGIGRVQTVLNFVLKKNGVKQKYLDDRWNMVSIHKKNMFVAGEDTMPYFMKYGYIWHFTGFSIEERIHIMNNVWNNCKDLYE